METIISQTVYRDSSGRAWNLQLDVGCLLREFGTLTAHAVRQVAAAEVSDFLAETERHMPKALDVLWRACRAKQPLPTTLEGLQGALGDALETAFLENDLPNPDAFTVSPWFDA